MDTGVYLNVFRVNFENQPIELMVVDRNRLPQLRELRTKLKEQGAEAHVYAVGDMVYGYGKNQQQLSCFGFRPTDVEIGSVPQLASRLILEGYVESLVLAGYTSRWSKRGSTVYQFGKPLLELAVGIKLYRGFHLQTLYLWNPEASELIYTLIIDATFTYRNSNGEPMSTSKIVRQFGSEALNQLLIRQGDLAPNGRINLEVSRQRLVDQTLPFVKARQKFNLACGINGSLELDPLRVVLTEEDKQL